MSHGVAGASYSGVKTAAEILGCTEEDLLKKMKGRIFVFMMPKTAASGPIGCTGVWQIKKRSESKINTPV